MMSSSDEDLSDGDHDNNNLDLFCDNDSDDEEEELLLLVAAKEGSTLLGEACVEQLCQETQQRWSVWIS